MPIALNSIALQKIENDAAPTALKQIREGIDEARAQGLDRVGCDSPVGVENAVGEGGANKVRDSRGLYIGLRRGNFV